MLSQESLSVETHASRADLEGGYATVNAQQGLELQKQLQRLDEIIVLEGTKIPLTGRTIIDEDQLLSQLLAVERSIPETIRNAERILNQREEIIARSKQYAQDIVKSAEQQAAKIADELTIIQQAESEAQQLRNQAQKEVEAIRQRNLREIERVRRQTQQEIDAMRQNAQFEREQVQAESDKYADRVLTDLEHQLADMLRVIKNGRNHLKANSQQKPKS